MGHNPKLGRLEIRVKYFFETALSFLSAYGVFLLLGNFPSVPMFLGLMLIYLFLLKPVFKTRALKQLDSMLGKTRLLDMDDLLIFSQDFVLLMATLFFAKATLITPIATVLFALGIYLLFKNTKVTEDFDVYTFSSSLLAIILFATLSLILSSSFILLVGLIISFSYLKFPNIKSKNIPKVFLIMLQNLSESMWKLAKLVGPYVVAIAFFKLMEGTFWVNPLVVIPTSIIYTSWMYK